VEDVKTAERASLAAGRRPVVYDGNDPAASIDVFKAGDADDIIANLESGMREGFTLNRADTMIYVSNSTKLLNRLQSEDRNYRFGQDLPTQIIDLLGEGTLDSKVLESLANKRDAVGTVLGDDPADWLRGALS